MIHLALLFPIIVALASPLTQSTSYAKGSITLSDLTDGPFTSLSYDVPQTSCPMSSVEYTYILSTPSGSRIPHSRIYMDGLRCGNVPDNATVDQLYKDSYMELMSIEALQSEQSARDNNVYRAFYELTVLSRPFPKSFFDFMSREFSERKVNTYIGFERYKDRVCSNGKEIVTLRRNSLVFIGAVAGKNVSVTQLITRLTKGAQVYLPPNSPYQISFSPAGGKADPEHVCPLKLDWRARISSQNINSTATPTPSANVRMCFPAHATLDGVNGETYRMDRLQVGDVVRAPFGGNTEVFMFSHNDRRTFSTMVNVQSENGSSLTLSSGHYVLTARGLVPAAELRDGDTLFTEHGTSRVTGTVETLEQGVFNPHTLSGMMLVDGLAVSCYTTAVNPVTAHALLAVVRMVYTLTKSRACVRTFLANAMRFGAPDSVARIVPSIKPMPVRVPTVVHQTPFLSLTWSS
ncbi:Desert hedgehog protein [Gracilariopsis chorda]|uniref:Desert hedgehog protein n=1 Tax=Gracilariopsis chorda TaxID=448386 RepID=A0A2V3J6P3_9FLOR|nr:Desert hedgehog protein [Gracilariopsis chorda]|eukprot:PXF49802.1 Desert hedgehog protein [Gracilariopsis chorda]